MPPRKLSEWQREKRVFLTMFIIAGLIIAGLSIYVFIMKPMPENDWGAKSGDWVGYCGEREVINYSPIPFFDNETWNNVYFTVLYTTNLGHIQNGSDATNLHYLVGNSPNDPSGIETDFPKNYAWFFLFSFLYATPPPSYLNIEQQVQVLKNWSDVILHDFFGSLLGFEISYTWVNSLAECDQENESYLGYQQDMYVFNFGLHHLWRVDFKIIISDVAIFHVTYWFDDQTGFAVKGQLSVVYDEDDDLIWDIIVNTNSELCYYGTLEGAFLQLGTFVEQYFFWIVITVLALSIALVPFFKKHIR